MSRHTHTEHVGTCTGTWTDPHVRMCAHTHTRTHIINQPNELITITANVFVCMGVLIGSDRGCGDVLITPGFLPFPTASHDAPQSPISAWHFYLCSVVTCHSLSCLLAHHLYWHKGMCVNTHTHRNATYTHTHTVRKKHKKATQLTMIYIHVCMCTKNLFILPLCLDKIQSPLG